MPFVSPSHRAFRWRFLLLLAFITSLLSVTFARPPAAMGEALMTTAYRVGTSYGSVTTSVSAACAEVCEDSTFTSSAWTLIAVQVGGGGSVSATFVGSGGSGGSYRQLTTTVNAAAGSAIWGYNGYVGSQPYNPAFQGAIQSIDYSEHAIALSGGGLNQGTGPALRQGGIIYFYNPRVPTPFTAWTQVSLTGLTAADFSSTPGGGGSNPDFSASGSPIECGFYRMNATSGGAYTVTGGIDNWELTIHHCCPEVCQDSTFAAAAWTLTPVTVGGGGTTSATFVPSGGFGGSYREVTTTVNAAPGSAIWGYHGSGCNYDPALEGAILSIDYGEDAISITGGGLGQGTGPALKQSGTIFFYNPRVATPFASWTNVSLTGLTAADFSSTPGGGGSNPDFSAGGGAIECGFYRMNATSGGAYTVTGGIDNWAMIIYHCCPEVCQDSTFEVDDWTLIPVAVGGGGTMTATQVASGGNGGPYRQLVATVNPAPGSAIWGFNGSPCVYTPALEGAIQSIDYDEDAIALSGGGLNQGTGPALKQGSSIYFYNPRTPTPFSSWTHLSLTGLMASDFSSTPGGGGTNPDFSPGGAAIQFGFYRMNATSGGGYTTIGGIDNWMITIRHYCSNPAGVASVPVPATPRAEGRGVMQVFPNPSGADVRVRFRIDLPGMISVKVYDVGGSLVRSVAESEYAAGEHEITWDGLSREGVRRPAGVYFLRVSGCGSVQTVKLLQQ